MTSQLISPPQPDLKLRRALVIGLLAVTLTAIMGYVGAASGPTRDLLRQWREQVEPYSIGIGNLFSAIMGVMLFLPGLGGGSRSLHELDQEPVSVSRAFWRRFLVGAITLPLLLDLPAGLLSRTLLPPSTTPHVPWIFVAVHLIGYLATTPIQHLAVYSTGALIGSVVKRPFFAAGLAVAALILVLLIPEWCRASGTSSSEGWGIRGATQGVWNFVSWFLDPDVRWQLRIYASQLRPYGAFCLFSFGISLTCALGAYSATRRGLAWRKIRPATEGTEGRPATSRERPS